MLNLGGQGERNDGGDTDMFDHEGHPIIGAGPIGGNPCIDPRKQQIRPKEREGRGKEKQ
ncbi:hypothetical protein FRC12_019727 [Ceratobasidium sp. 428]|nr:hypothetical protein FRC12_019727 [Ceratobasidium sp. 428]